MQDMHALATDDLDIDMVKRKADDLGVQLPRSLLSKTLPYHLKSKAELGGEAGKCRKVSGSALGRMWTAVSSGSILQQEGGSALLQQASMAPRRSGRTRRMGPRAQCEKPPWLDEQLKKETTGSDALRWTQKWGRHFDEYNRGYVDKVLPHVRQDGSWSEQTKAEFGKLVLSYRAKLLAGRDTR